MSDLVVELYGTQIGTLTGSWRDFDFVAEPAALGIFGIDSPILSVAIPLAARMPRGRKSRRQNFFRELLPEGRMRARMAQQAGVAEHDVIGLLRHYGRDIAGALQIWDPRAPGEPKEPAVEPLTIAETAQLLTDVQDNPLGNKPFGGKTSLAGVQDKIVLARIDGQWNRVIDGYPSTHILKPESPNNPTAIYDEEYGSRFARATGLADFETWIEEFDGTPALVIERYDRSNDTQMAGRIHQEDFNQALGASGDQKYQKLGGQVSLARIAAILADIDHVAVEKLLRMMTLAVAVGNVDLHAKNISLVHFPDGTTALAPAYDVVPQAHQPTDGEMAMAIDQEYRHRAITRRHLIAEGTTWGLPDADRIIDHTLLTIRQVAATEAPHQAAHPALATDIAQFATNLLTSHAVGDTARAAKYDTG